MPSRITFSGLTTKVLLAAGIFGAVVLATLTWSGIKRPTFPFENPARNVYQHTSLVEYASYVETSRDSTRTAPATALPTPFLFTSSWKAYHSATMGTSSGEAISSFTTRTLPSTSSSSSELASLALKKVLDDASPVFGHYQDVQSDTSTWMSAYPDSTLIVHMNIPGVHDAATWNYSLATHESLKSITQLVNAALEFRPEDFRCQEQPFIDMLNAGIRAFDLRYAHDITNTSIVFWHGPALQSQTATLENVLFGFYRWLDDHPSEAIFLSFQYESSKDMENIDNTAVQKLLCEALTNIVAEKYIRQDRGALGTLGEAKGKITLLRRFDLDKLPSDHEASIPGLHFSPKDWTVNGANISIVYTSSDSVREGGETGTAYIQDYYQPLTSENSTIETNIQSKEDAIFGHFRMAASVDYSDSLFWSFISATNILHAPPITPRMLALGQNKDGLNHRFAPFLGTMQSQRLGFVMFDFFQEPKELIPLFLNLKRSRI